MKLALVFLVCFVAVTYQQQQQANFWSRPLQNKALYYDPYYFAYANEPLQSSIASESKEAEDNQFRFRFGMRPQQKKFFSLSSLPSPFTFFNSFQTIPMTTSTSTAFVTTVLTATIASVQSCLPSSLFVTQLGIAGAVTLTTPCARKRRSIDAISEELSPSQVTFVEPSAAPEIKLDEQHVISGAYFKTGDLPEVESSQQRDSASAEQYIIASPNFALRNSAAFLQPPRTLTVTSTVTSTLTSYSFATTLFKRSIILSGPNALSCVPPAYPVC